MTQGNTYNLVILYYNFTKIEDPEKFCEVHKRLCRFLELKGRVYVSQEGINGTLSGLPLNIIAYQQYLTALPGFEKTEFKEDRCEKVPFQKLIVKTRPEIVTLKSSVDINMAKEAGKHLSPEEWKKVLDEEKDITLIDVRNNYESAIGYFDGAITPDVENFYDFEEWLDKADLKKDKKVLMYCTGGIRCEKFSLLMEKKGFQDVNQLQGGIINYANKIGDAHYKGKCFVFDDRLAVPIEKNQEQPLAKCEITDQPSDSYMNCHNMDCNKLFVCSEEGAKKYDGCCSEECMKAKRRRPFNPKDIYAPSLRWYHYYQDKSEMITE